MEEQEGLGSHSSAEAEVSALVEGICEVVWTLGILTELGIVKDICINLFCHNVWFGYRT